MVSNVFKLYPMIALKRFRVVIPPNRDFFRYASWKSPTSKRPHFFIKMLAINADRSCPYHVFPPFIFDIMKSPTSFDSGLGVGLLRYSAHASATNSALSVAAYPDNSVLIESRFILP